MTTPWHARSGLTALAFALVVAGLAEFAFGWTLSLLGGAFVLTVVGAPMAIAATLVVRRFVHLERFVAGRVLGTPIPRYYRPVTGNWWRRLPHRAGRPRHLARPGLARGGRHLRGRALGRRRRAVLRDPLVRGLPAALAGDAEGSVRRRLRLRPLRLAGELVHRLGLRGRLRPRLVVGDAAADAPARPRRPLAAAPHGGRCAAPAGRAARHHPRRRRSTPARPNCAASSATCTTGSRPGSSRWA